MLSLFFSLLLLFRVVVVLPHLLFLVNAVMPVRRGVSCPPRWGYTRGNIDLGLSAWLAAAYLRAARGDILVERGQAWADSCSGRHRLLCVRGSRASTFRSAGRAPVPLCISRLESVSPFLFAFRFVFFSVRSSSCCGGGEVSRCYRRARGITPRALESVRMS